MLWCRLTLETGSHCFFVSVCVSLYVCALALVKSMHVCRWVQCVCVCVFVSVSAQGPQKEDDGCETNMLLQKPEVCLLPIFSTTTLKRETEKHANRSYQHALLLIFFKMLLILSHNNIIFAFLEHSWYITDTNNLSWLRISLPLHAVFVLKCWNKCVLYMSSLCELLVIW